MKVLYFIAFVAAVAGCSVKKQQLTSQINSDSVDEIIEPVGNFPTEKFGKVAVVQWAPSVATPLNVTLDAAEKFKQRNREVLARYIEEAVEKGAEMVLTPEFSVVGYPDIPELPSEEDDYRNRDDIAPYVETIPGPTTNYFSAIAKKHGIFVQIGFAEVDPNDDKYYNATVMIDPQGDIVGKFRKMNLYQLENDFLSPGTDPVTFDSPFGRIGYAICADIYSTHPMADYKTAGVDVIALSTSWAVMNSGFSAFSSAAKRYGFYVLASNQNYFPDSGVINPDGSAQSHIRQTTGVAYGYLPRVSH